MMMGDADLIVLGLRDAIYHELVCSNQQNTWPPHWGYCWLVPLPAIVFFLKIFKNQKKSEVTKQI